MKLKKMIAVCALALCAVPFAASAELSKAEWQAKVGDCANNPSAMKATIAQIPASEQAEFVGKVNEAIGKKPGSAESKAADFYAVNKAAVSGASDKSSVLAEVFATVPVEYLTDMGQGGHSSNADEGSDAESLACKVCHHADVLEDEVHESGSDVFGLRVGTCLAEVGGCHVEG